MIKSANEIMQGLSLEYRYRCDICKDRRWVPSADPLDLGGEPCECAHRFFLTDRERERIEGWKAYTRQLRTTYGRSVPLSLLRELKDEGKIDSICLQLATRPLRSMVLYGETRSGKSLTAKTLMRRQMTADIESVLYFEDHEFMVELQDERRDPKKYDRLARYIASRRLTVIDDLGSDPVFQDGPKSFVERVAISGLKYVLDRLIEYRHDRIDFDLIITCNRPLDAFLNSAMASRFIEICEGNVFRIESPQ